MVWDEGWSLKISTKHNIAIFSLSYESNTFKTVSYHPCKPDYNCPTGYKSSTSAKKLLTFCRLEIRMPDCLQNEIFFTWTQRETWSKHTFQRAWASGIYCQLPFRAACVKDSEQTDKCSGPSKCHNQEELMGMPNTAGSARLNLAE